MEFDSRRRPGLFLRGNLIKKMLVTHRNLALIGIILFAALPLFLMNFPAYGQGIMVGKDKEFHEGVLTVPYVFYNENFGAAAGFVYGSTGIPQKQMTLLATLIAGTNDALAFYGLARDVQVPFISERLFLDADLALSTFGTIYSYTGGNPKYTGQQAGTNDSNDDNWIRGPGSDNIARVKLRYLIPVGTGKKEVISTYMLDQGLLVEGAQGGSSWNPLSSGKMYLEVRPFLREQEVRSRFSRLDNKTNGVDFSLVHDNTDFPRNPSVGHYIRARWTEDWGWFDSSTKYQVVDVEFSKYFSLGPSETFRQRVLAFDMWTANSPTWDDFTTKHNGRRVYERPPSWAGATLGGIWRLRAYPSARFHDQAVIYYSGEYRMTPKWNPFANIEWLQKHVGISWWQLVPFIEVGRVAPNWNLSTLHSKMKWDGGLGVRAMAKGIVVRIDAAIGNAGNYGVQMMVGHPFNF